MLRRSELVVILVLVASGMSMYFWGFRNPLDAKYYYSHDEAFHFFSSLTKLDIEMYLKNEFFDLFFLISYTALTIQILRRFAIESASLIWLSSVPGFFDLVENITITSVLLGIVQTPPFWLGLITWIKWTSGFILAVYVLNLIFRKRIKKLKDLS